MRPQIIRRSGQPLSLSIAVVKFRSVQNVNVQCANTAFCSVPYRFLNFEDAILHAEHGATLGLLEDLHRFSGENRGTLSHTCTHMHTQTRTNTHIHTRTHTLTFTHTHKLTHARTHGNTYLHLTFCRVYVGVVTLSIVLGLNVSITSVNLISTKI